MESPLKAPLDDDGFVVSFDVTDTASVAFFEKYGFVVFQDVLSEEEIAATLQAPQLFGSDELDRGDPATWPPFFAKQRFAFAGIIGATATLSVPELNNRQNPRVRDGFARVLGTRELTVDHDRLGAMCPTVLADGTEKDEWRTISRWLHLDCNPNNGKAAIAGFMSTHEPIDFSKTVIPQGLITLTDARVEDGGFHCVPGAHKIALEWASKRGDKKGSNMDVRDRDPLMECVQKIPIRKGCLLVWTSLLFHGNHPNHSSRWRCVQYIRMMPKEGTPFSALPLHEYFPDAFQMSPLGKKLFY